MVVGEGLGAWKVGKGRVWGQWMVVGEGLGVWMVVGEGRTEKLAKRG